MRCSLNPLGAEEELVEQLRVDEVPGQVTDQLDGAISGDMLLIDALRQIPRAPGLEARLSILPKLGRTRSLARPGSDRTA